MRDESTDEWRGPAFYTLGSASLGLQFGVQQSEIIILVMNRNGVNAMLDSGLKLGASMSIAAGPVGMGTAAATTDIVAYSRSKGLFGALSVVGEVLSIDRRLNQGYYGKPLDSIDILVRNDVPDDQPAMLLALVNRISGDK